MNTVEKETSKIIEILKEWNHLLTELKEKNINIEKIYQTLPSEPSAINVSINFDKNKYKKLKDYNFEVFSQIILIEEKQYPIFKLQRNYVLKSTNNDYSLCYLNEVYYDCENYTKKSTESYLDKIHYDFVFLDNNLKEKYNENISKISIEAKSFILRNSLFENLKIDDFKIMLIEIIKNDQNLNYNEKIIKNLYELKENLSDKEFIELCNLIYYAFLNKFNIKDIKEFLEILKIEHDFTYDITNKQIFKKLQQ